MITSHNFAVRTSAAVDVLIYCWSTLRVADVSPSAAHHVVIYQKLSKIGP